MSTSGEPLPRVVIVGGGFGGLNAARSFDGAPVQVTLVDRYNYHLFQPLLYQVATAALNPSDIASPLRGILRRQSNVEVILGDAIAVEPASSKLILSDGELSYDHLILATGATHSYFGHPEWSSCAPGLKTIEDAIEIRRRVFLAFEAAERESEEARRKAWLTFAVVGAGPTGVELAGALAEIARRALRGDFRHFDPAKAEVILLEGLPVVLPAYDPPLSTEARRELQAIGVDVRTGARVTSIDDDGLDYEDATGRHRLRTRTVLWAAGVAASPLARSLGVPLDRSGRVIVNPDLTIPNHENVYVIGDLAASESEGRKVPGIAPAAIQTGRRAAQNILLTLTGRPREPFVYRDRGSLATIGRSAAVGTIERVRLKGFLAWCAWLFIHILMLIGFRNRFAVLFGWAWAYVVDRRPARLITAPSPKLLEPRSEDSSANKRPPDIH